MCVIWSNLKYRMVHILIKDVYECELINNFNFAATTDNGCRAVVHRERSRFKAIVALTDREYSKAK